MLKKICGWILLLLGWGLQFYALASAFAGGTAFMMMVISLIIQGPIQACVLMGIGEVVVFFGKKFLGKQSTLLLELMRSYGLLLVVYGISLVVGSSTMPAIFMVFPFAAVNGAYGMTGEMVITMLYAAFIFGIFLYIIGALIMNNAEQRIKKRV